MKDKVFLYKEKAICQIGSCDKPKKAFKVLGGCVSDRLLLLLSLMEVPIPQIVDIGKFATGRLSVK